jgi:hypothetical protein
MLKIHTYPQHINDFVLKELPIYAASALAQTGGVAALHDEALDVSEYMQMGR